MVDLGHQKLWDGPIEQTPWWFPYLIRLETRLDSIRETAAYDPDKLPPPKDIWPLYASDELDEYLESRRKENERRMKEKQPLDDDWK